MVRDPSMIRQGSTRYVFSTDAGAVGSYFQIRSSDDKVNETLCGHISCVAFCQGERRIFSSTLSTPCKERNCVVNVYHISLIGLGLARAVRVEVEGESVGAAKEKFQPKLTTPKKGEVGGGCY
jgi:hypothetical protein